MKSYKTLTLLKGKEKALNRKHPWVFSGAFAESAETPEEGEVVKVNTASGECCGMGFYRNGGIRVLLFSFKEVDDIKAFFTNQLEKAIELRKQLGFFKDKNTNCFRLCFGEGDAMPGLVIDKYGATAVIQVHHNGWQDFLKVISEILLSQANINQVYSKPSAKTGLVSRYLHKPETANNEVQENGNRFIIDWEGGQKTGFFIDQRQNRKRLSEMAKGKSVLNTFAYTGGFSVYALAAGAQKVVSVDLSAPAIELANENAKLNGFSEQHTGIVSDVVEHLKNEGDQYDIIVLDPPAFSKSKRTVHKAVQAYKRLNMLAFKRIKPGGLIFTFSCSQHISAQLFIDTLRAAGIESEREIQVLEKLGQPIDHPMNLFFPEGEYLKGAILRVN
jgi:23S rRNA (cytosine1962-C5)-methyltransferase